MTVGEALNLIDERKPNEFSQERKLEWLSLLDGRIDREILRTHCGAPQTAFARYRLEDDMDTELLADDVYRDMYLYFLECRMDYERGELERYNNSAVMFEQRYMDYAADYNRTHRPVPAGGYRW